MISKLTFHSIPHARSQKVIPGLTVIPVIDRNSLIDMVTTFETENLFEPAGGYGPGIDFYCSQRFKDLENFFFGRNDPGVIDEGKIWLLGCSGCGELGCWPLICSVSTAGNTVVWDRFHQPHRPQRDYSQFGAFTFTLDQYCAVLQELHTNLQSLDEAKP
jgi:hypothetical protein